MKYYIGIDLGGTNVRTLLVDENGVVHSEVKDSTESNKGPDYVCDKIIKQGKKIKKTGFISCRNGGFSCTTSWKR